jgi:hypothetical protein
MRGDVIVLVFVALLCSIGFMMILVSAVYCDTGLPFLNFVAIMLLAILYMSCMHQDQTSFLGDGDDDLTVSWGAAGMGALVVSLYCGPLVLFRAGTVSPLGSVLTMAANTMFLLAMMVLLKKYGGGTE